MSTGRKLKPSVKRSKISCPQCQHKQDDMWQYCKSCGYNIFYRQTNVIYKPGWVDVHKRLMPHPEKMDSNAEIKAVDVMLSEREKEMKVSARARNWEKGRKKEWAANKPYALKGK